MDRIYRKESNQRVYGIKWWRLSSRSWISQENDRFSFWDLFMTVTRNDIKTPYSVPFTTTTILVSLRWHSLLLPSPIACYHLLSATMTCFYHCPITLISIQPPYQQPACSHDCIFLIPPLPSCHSCSFLSLLFWSYLLCRNTLYRIQRTLSSQSFERHKAITITDWFSYSLLTVHPLSHVCLERIERTLLFSKGQGNFHFTLSSSPTLSSKPIFYDL